jgi:hypothetical protein
VDTFLRDLQFGILSAPSLMSFPQRTAAAMPDMQNHDPIGFNGKDNPVYVRPATVKQMAHLERRASVFGGERTALGACASEAITFSNPSNQRSPVDPAYCEISQSRMPFKSASASLVYSTRKVMFPA